MLWFWWWLAFVVLLLILLGYGWGYRGWGAPSPLAYRRRRANAGVGRPEDPELVTVEEDPVSAEQAASWGLLADVLWVMAVAALVWLLLGLML